MRYCGIVPAGGLVQLVLLEEQPPAQLRAVFFEPDEAHRVAAELLAMREIVVAAGAPLEPPGASRLCDQLLRRRGVAPRSFDPALGETTAELDTLGVFAPRSTDPEGPVPEDSFQQARVLETNPDGVFCALRSRRLPARRHPQGIRLRIDGLDRQRVIDDDGGGFWNRRIEEIDAAAAALCAHRYAAAEASWLGVAEEGVLVLPGVTLPGKFSTDGVLAPVERLQLPRV